jgi:hypothetical protein
MTDEVQSICRKMEAENAACGATVREIPFWVGTSAAVDGLMTWRSWSGMNTWNILKHLETKLEVSVRKWLQVWTWKMPALWSSGTWTVPGQHARQ